MADETRFLRFEDRSAPDRKTKTVAVISVRGGDTLGVIRWFGRWRQYAFFPASETAWNPECLDDVNAKIRALMAERRATGGETP